MKSALLLPLALLLFLLPNLAFSELPEQLVADFSPTQGYVVMPLDDTEFIIDLDASKGLTTGDILSIIEQGKKLVHPISKEVIGTLDDKITFLQTTRLKSGYSYARKIRGDNAVAKGARVQRFKQVPAIFDDPSHLNPQLKIELQQQLNMLDWHDDKSEIQPLLHFEIATGSLLVKNQDGSILRSYPISVQTPTAANVTAISPAIQTRVNPNGNATPLQQGSTPSTYWNSPAFNKEFIGINVADFNTDGRQETVILSQDTLSLGIFMGQTYKQINEFKLPASYNFIALDSFDLNKNGRPEIFISGLRDNKPHSLVLEIENGQFIQLAQKVPMLFRVIEQPGQGQILLGQKRHQFDIPFDQRPFKVALLNGEYKKGDSYPLPVPINIYGFTPFNSKDGENFFAYLTADDYLNLKSVDGSEIYDSSDRYGGSQISFELISNDPTEGSYPYYVPLRILSANGRLLVPQNSGTRFTKRLTTYNKGHIKALEWNGVSTNEAWHTTEQEGPITDFSLADIDNDGQLELATTVVFKRKGFLSKSRSAVVIHELK